MGRHANGDTPTGVLYIKPDDPKFRRAAGGRKTGKIPRIKPPSAETGFLPALPAESTAVIPAQRRSPEQAAPRVAVAVAVPAQRAPRQQMSPQQMSPQQMSPQQMPEHRMSQQRMPEPRVPAQRAPSGVPAVQMNMRLAPPPMRSPEPISARAPRTLPTWTKVCVVLGAVLILVGFGGLGAAYAVNGKADPTTTSGQLITR